MGLKYSYRDSVSTSNCDSLIALARRGVTTGDCYGLLIDVAEVLTGAGATGPRSWGVGIVGDKTEGALITAGCDDAYLRISGSNYVANAEIFYFRGLNCNVNNRSGGVVGGLENLISVSAKVGSVQSTIRGLQVSAQDLSADTGDEFGGLDVVVNREGGVNTVEYGLQLRTSGTINTAIKTAINVKKGASDYGFASLFTLSAIADIGGGALSGDVTFTTDGIKIPVVIGATTYYIPAQPSI